MNIQTAGTDVGPGRDQAGVLALARTLSSFFALIQDERLVYVNPVGCALLGRPPEFFVGRHVREVLHPEDREAATGRAQAWMRETLPSPRLCERLVHADGRTIWLDCFFDVIQLDGRATTLMTGHDVTECRRIEEDLRRSEARLAEAQRIGHFGSWEWDLVRGRIAWSVELCRVYGVAPRDFGETLEGYISLVHPDDRTAVRGVMEQALRDGRPFAFEHRIVHRDGRVRTIFCRGEVFEDESGSPVRVAGTGQDITDRRHMEADLRGSEERFRLAFMGAAIGKTIVAPDRRLLQINPAVSRMLGYTDAELVGRTVDDITHPDDLARSIEFIERRLQSNEARSDTFEKRLIHKDGHVVWTLVTSTLVRAPDGEPLYLIGEVQDISEQKRAVEALKESEERFRNLCTQAPVMLMSFEPNGRVRDVSNYWLQTMGYTREEIVGHDGWRLITPESRARIQEAIETNQRHHETVIKNFPLRGIKKDGTTIDLLSTSVAEIGDDGESKGAICVEIDLTDLQRAEAALRESEERYRALVEHAPEAIMVLDVEQGLFVDANAHAEKLFGRSRAELLTMGPLDLCSERQADGRRTCELMDEEHRKVLEGGTSVFESTHIDAAGRKIHCQTRLSRLPAAGRKLIRATTNDISEHKQLEEKVRHAEKLAAAGALAAGVAHEIGNPLMALSMAAQSLERKACDDYTQKKLSLIREHIDRISRIVRQMSDLARPASGLRASCDLNQVVHRAVDMVIHDKRCKDSEIRYELATRLPAVVAVEDELVQVCINLALNAFDAMAANPTERPRRLTIRSESTESSVRVSFEDTGPGVPREIRPKLFEPFFTTKEAGHGTGLGLSVSYRILQEHGGSLRLEDAAPGALFAFELPREGNA